MQNTMRVCVLGRVRLLGEIRYIWNNTEIPHLEMDIWNIYQFGSSPETKQLFDNFRRDMVVKKQM